MSSTENYIVFGANVDENSVISHRFIKMALKDIIYLESQVFNIVASDVAVEFVLGELPNDMKMLTILGGELSNAAHFFLTFADVNKEVSKDVSKTFGMEDDHYWKPWKYEKRVSDAEKVKIEK